MNEMLSTKAKTTRQYKERAQQKHTVGELSLTIRQWAKHFDVNSKTFANWVRAEGIKLAVTKIMTGEHKVRAKKQRKERSDSGTAKKAGPDMTKLTYNPDLELKRRIAAYRKQGINDQVIYDRERRAFGNQR